MFTAVIIMQLIEEGKLSLDTRLSEYYPQLKKSKKITIEMMLRHRSGIFNVTNSNDYLEWMTNDISEEEMLFSKKIQENGKSKKPNKTTSYSNSNYILLTYIAERITGKTLDVLLQERICTPCLLEQTSIGLANKPEDNEAYSYFHLGDYEKAPVTSTSCAEGAGSVTSTPYDLNLFINCLFHKGLVNESSLNSMRNLIEGFGLGMFRFTFKGTEGLGHTGGIDGFSSALFYLPEQNLTIAYSSNGSSLAMNKFLEWVVDVCRDKEIEFPDFEPLYVPLQEDLDQYPGVYTSKKFPLDLTISVRGNAVVGQATGQPEFVMEALDRHYYQLKAAGLVIVFVPEENKLILKQGGKEWELYKE